MAKQQRVSRKDVLSKPDPSEMFARRVNATIYWGKDNFRYILYGLLSLLVIAILIVVWTSWQRHRREQASLLLHQALKLVDEDPNARQSANRDQAIERLQAITKEYGRTPAGARAYWHLGHLYYTQGKMSEALESYQMARRRLPNRQPLSSTLAILDIAYAQEATDACGEAIASYESVLQSPIHWLRGEAYLGMGRCHEKAGATEKAIEDYDRALADVHVTGAAQQTISERLARLRPSEPATPAETPVIKDDNSSSAVAPNASGDKAEQASTPAETATPPTQSSDTAPSETAGEAKSK